VTPDAADLAARLDRIQTKIDALAKVHSDAIQQQALAERIQREILAAKRALRPID
jgi:hypothetical protein